MVVVPLACSRGPGCLGDHVPSTERQMRLYLWAIAWGFVLWVLIFIIMLEMMTL